MYKKTPYIIVFITISVLIFYYVNNHRKKIDKTISLESETIIKKDFIDSLRFKEKIKKEVNSRWNTFKEEAEKSLNEVEEVLGELSEEYKNSTNIEKRVRDKKLNELKLKLKVLRQRLETRNWRIEKDMIDFGNYAKNYQKTFEKEFKYDVNLIKKRLDILLKKQPQGAPNNNIEKQE